MLATARKTNTGKATGRRNGRTSKTVNSTKPNVVRSSRSYPREGTLEKYDKMISEMEKIRSKNPNTAISMTSKTKTVSMNALYQQVKYGHSLNKEQLKRIKMLIPQWFKK